MQCELREGRGRGFTAPTCALWLACVRGRHRIATRCHRWARVGRGGRACRPMASCVAGVGCAFDGVQGVGSQAGEGGRRVGGSSSSPGGSSSSPGGSSSRLATAHTHTHRRAPPPTRTLALPSPAAPLLLLGTPQQRWRQWHQSSSLCSPPSASSVPYPALGRGLRGRCVVHAHTRTAPCARAPTRPPALTQAHLPPLTGSPRPRPPRPPYHTRPPPLLLCSPPPPRCRTPRQPHPPPPRVRDSRQGGAAGRLRGRREQQQQQLMGETGGGGGAGSRSTHPPAPSTHPPTHPLTHPPTPAPARSLARLPVVRRER